MGDNDSTNSDWESIKGDDAVGQLDTARVVVELPSEGLSGAAAARSSSSGANAGHEGNDDHDLIEATNNHIDAHSAAGSSISSFVPVTRFNKMSMQQKIVVTMSDGALSKH